MILQVAPAAEPQDAGRTSVPVRLLGANPAPVTAAADNGSEPAATPIPPQYRTRPSRAKSLTDFATQPGRVRFLVALPDRPLLVEARIGIDGRPFTEVREARIAQLLAAIANAPASRNPKPAESAAPPTPSAPAASPEGGAAPNTAASEAAATGASAPSQVTAAIPPWEPSIEARIRRYAQAIGRTPSSEECHWLLANWLDGPAVLWLGDNFEALRANASPVFRILDRDRNERLSAVETQSAADSLLAWDTNRDETLTLTELLGASGGSTPPGSRPHVSSFPLAVPSDQLSRLGVQERLASYYGGRVPGVDADEDGNVSAAEQHVWAAQEPDVVVDAQFDTGEPGASRLSVAALHGRWGQVVPQRRGTALTLPIGQTWLEFSAVQDLSAPAADQVSLGAVRDGYPVLPWLDTDEDGRLTPRELRQVSARLAVLDRDQDGHIAQTELWPTVRVAIGVGPTVHRHLASVRTIYPEASAGAPIATPPEWFRRMDRNEDSDLTPREFLGGKDQFEQLDADSDGLISVAEALHKET